MAFSKYRRSSLEQLIPEQQHLVPVSSPVHRHATNQYDEPLNNPTIISNQNKGNHTRWPTLLRWLLLTLWRSKCRQASTMLFLVLLLFTMTVRRWPLQPLMSAAVILSNPPISMVQLEKTIARGLSDKAWEDLLQRFRHTMEQPLYEYNWLPVILRYDDMWVTQQHATTLHTANDHRLPFFTDMIRQALTLGKEYRKRSKRKRLQQKYEDEGSHIESKLPLLQANMTRMAIPLFMFLGDTINCHGRAFPRFGWCSLRDSEQTCVNFALPTYTFFDQAPEQSLRPRQFYENHRHLQYPWSSKLQKAVWRGSASGHTPHGWTTIPRAQLVNVSIHHPDLLDAAFTEANEVKKFYPEEWIKLHNFSRFGDWIDLADFQKYRAIVDIDGNSWSDRFGNVLCLNSVVVKVQPANMNYFFHELKPWVHYIPVSSDMSNLTQALAFAVSNETEASVQSIVHQANEWCRLRASKERFAQDVFWMLNSYVRLLGTNQTRWKQWEELFAAFEQNFTLVLA